MTQFSLFDGTISLLFMVYLLKCDFPPAYRVTKDHFVFHGINIDLFQCGVELKSKIVTSLPWAFGLKINIKEQKYEMNLSPSKTDTELFSVKYVFQDFSCTIVIHNKVPPNILMISYSSSNSSNVFTVLRNIEDPSLSKITPMMPETENSQQGLPLARRILPTSRDEQVQYSSPYNSRTKWRCLSNPAV